jgi:hypothetical protein
LVSNNQNHANAKFALPSRSSKSSAESSDSSDSETVIQSNMKRPKRLKTQKIPFFACL